MQCRFLIDPTTFLRWPGKYFTSSTTTLILSFLRTTYLPNVVSLSIAQHVQHHIDTTSPSICSKAHPPPHQKLTIAPKEYMHTFQQQLVISTQTIPDRYRFPFFQDFAQYLSNCRDFSTFDLTRAYHHMPVAPVWTL